MRKSAVLVAASVLLAGTPLLEASSSPTLDWKDSTRDVYVNGVLDREAQVVVTGTGDERRLAVISSRLSAVPVLTLKTRDLAVAPATCFAVSKDRSRATSDADLDLTPRGVVVEVDGGGTLFTCDGANVLLTRHTGPSGPIDEAALFAAVPVWKALFENATPDPAAVAALAAVTEPTRLRVVFGTWCGDSKAAVPRLLAAVREARNPLVEVQLLAAAPKLLAPLAKLQELGVTNVPTVIVEREGVELGRFVETALSASVESDLGVLVAGGNPTRLPRKDELIAQGTYVHRDAEGRVTRTESFRILKGKTGGRTIESDVHAAGESLEVVESAGADGETRFAQVTRRGPSRRVERTRYSRDGDTLYATLRGGETGIAEQTVRVPARFALRTEAAATAGLKGRSDLPRGCVYDTSEPGQVLGRLCEASWELLPRESVFVAAGELPARHLVESRRGETVHTWVHAELGIPVWGRKGSGTFELATLDIPNAETRK